MSPQERRKYGSETDGINFDYWLNGKTEEKLLNRLDGPEKGKVIEPSDIEKRVGESNDK